MYAVVLAFAVAGGEQAPGGPCGIFSPRGTGLFGQRAYGYGCGGASYGAYGCEGAGYYYVPVSNGCSGAAYGSYGCNGSGTGAVRPPAVQEPKAMPKPKVDTEAGPGQVQLVNQWTRDVTWVVNGKVHVVGPGSYALVAMPVGEVAWQVHAAGHGLLEEGTTVVNLGMARQLTLR